MFVLSSVVVVSFSTTADCEPDLGPLPAWWLSDDMSGTDLLDWEPDLGPFPAWWLSDDMSATDLLDALLSSTKMFVSVNWRKKIF